ncbi:MAG: DUF1287 domain-containing protein [Gammaproteobacteria bacterium]|nr:MAG: DUF1287 domain-containing protein [Gammaproteobacteria bacterium]
MKKLLFFFLLFFLSNDIYADNFQQDFVKAAIERTTQNVVYDGSYKKIAYPNGDVPANTGVCTDVIIRSYRKVGTDLQKLVHIDMKKNFSKYPSERIWGLKSTDKNIDHRRVPNLQVFFKRFGKKLPVTKNSEDYKPGDIVTWMLPGHLPHIGIVTNKISKITLNPIIAHNIGLGPKLDDMLFNYPISGHFRYKPKKY